MVSLTNLAVMEFINLKIDSIMVVIYVNFKMYFNYIVMYRMNLA